VSSDARLVRRRWRAPRPAPAGQVTVLMALFITALLGAAALSVDLGYAYVQHRRMQNLADSAATAGTLALEKNGTGVTDAQVKLAMLNNLTAAGVQVRWDTATTPATPIPTTVTVRADYIYVDSATGAVTDAHTLVGAGAIPSMTSGGVSETPNGIRVDSLSINAPAFFAAVLGRTFFAVRASGAEAIAVPPPANVAGTATATPPPTQTGTATATPPPTGTATATGTAPATATPPGTSTQTGTATATGTPAPTTTPLPGPCATTITVTSPLPSTDGYYATFTTVSTGAITATWTISTSSSAGDVYAALYQGTPAPLTGGSGLVVGASDDPSTNTTLQGAQVALTDQPPQPGTAERVTVVYPASAAGNPGPGVYTVYFYNANTNKVDEVGPATVSYPGQCGPIIPPTATPTGTATASPTPTGTAMASPTPTGTATATPTAPPTATPTLGPPPAPFVPFALWGGNPGGLRIGGDYTVWGRSWDAQVDPTSSGYDTTARFKGYIDTLPTGWDPAHPTLPSCPAGSTDPMTCWSTGPGASSHPPAGSPPLDAAGCLPVTMDVLVIADATKVGGIDYGGVTAIVEIAVDTPCAYQPDPGHPLNGTIIQAVWDPSHLVRPPLSPTPGPIQVSGS